MPSAPPPVPAPTPQPNPLAKAQQSPAFLSIVNELDVNRDQLAKRQALITDIEAALSARYGSDNKMVAYTFRFGHPRASINSADLAPLESVLKSVSGAQQINVLIHSPGGDGTVIEKMVEVARAQLAGQNQKLRVIIPNLAKSAATLFALGADEILMGYTSEIGPIDPQIQIAISGMAHWISALAFVEVRDNLMAAINDAIKKGQPIAGLQMQLASLNMPYTREMENQINFSRKTAVKLLNRYMFASKFANHSTRRKKANKTAGKLLSKQLFPVHGHFINATTAQQQLDLEVDILAQNDPLWELIWSYYVRTEIQMNTGIQLPMVKIKLFESATVSLVTQDTVN
jgi:hypothetical protein